MSAPYGKSEPRKSDRPSTPGRPHDASRQQKHQDQNLESGSGELDRRSKKDSGKRPPIPPGAK